MDFAFDAMSPECRKYLDQLEKIEHLEVAVGYQAGQAYDDGTSLVDVVAYNEYGTSRMPARPFMKQSFENHEDRLQAACEQVLKEMSEGATAQEALNRLGVFLKGLVQEEIVEGGFAPNAESTIRQKGSAQPLIDTGFMRQSVQYEVRGRTDG